MTFAENLGANCQNCSNRGIAKACRKCANSENKSGWEPAEGVRVKVYDVFLGPKLISRMGREVVTEANQASVTAPA